MSNLLPNKRGEPALPPLPTPGEGEYIYGVDPVTGKISEEPVGIRGAVNVPIDLWAEYREAYGLEVLKVEAFPGLLVAQVRARRESSL
jgi:hypothetical protein